MNITAYSRLNVVTILLTLVFVACSEEGNPVKDFSLGSIDASVYVAVGGNYTAGMQSGALFEEGQKFSYPNLIAAQLKTSEFVQPLMPYPGTGELRLLASISPPMITSLDPAINPPSNISHPKAYNNLGIPNAIIFDALDTSPITERGVSRGNPFYQMIMRNQSAYGVSLVDQAIGLNPTVLTFWLGVNDVLMYAISGGTRGTNTGSDGDIPGKFPTEIGVFRQSIQAAFAKIKTSLPNARVFVANIPDPTLLPFFTTVPRKMPNPNNPDQPLSIYYRNNDNNVISVGPNEYVLLTAQQELQTLRGLSPDNPLPSAFVLDEGELSVLRGAVEAYNTALYSEALRQEFTIVDMNAFFDRIAKDGVHIAGEFYNAAFISGGVFSLDGIHLSARGNALVANQFIAAMNEAYGASIHNVQLHTLPGIPAPTNVLTR